jgi:hypothetical protein
MLELAGISKLFGGLGALRGVPLSLMLAVWPQDTRLGAYLYPCR